MKIFKIGMQFGAGAFLAVSAIIWLAAVIADFTTPFDDCDGPTERCGMRVLTDHKTGLQYLEARGGGIVPRLTVTGAHMRDDSQ
ncbi:hypothetical protein [Halomonas sp. RT37]|uniref:Uncharacterized protein n=1 Tax=Halomonas sp. RT37 TaxID=2950872 RepID=A0AAU7KCS5_9GAMM